MPCASGAPYTVQAGDTLFSIAQNLLGNGNLYTETRNTDGTIPDPAQLQPGQVLCLPATTVPGGNGFGSIVSQQIYKTIFPNSNALYTYDGLIAAAGAYPLFCNEGPLQQNLQEAAAFLANISHETGALVFVDEQNPPIIYRDATSTTYPCALDDPITAAGQSNCRGISTMAHAGALSGRICSTNLTWSRRTAPLPS